MSEGSIWRNRSFRRFFLGQFVTNAGDSLYSVAILWLVFKLSGSTFLTGIASALLLLPFLLQIIAGPFVDRLPLRGLLVGVQLAQGIVVLTVPLAAALGHLSVGLLFAIIPILSLLTVLVAPVPTALLPRLLSEDQLSSGNAALATVSLGLDMLFDAAGGVFIAIFGATALFVLDAGTFAVAGALFAGMVIPPTKSGGGEEQTGTDRPFHERARARIETYLDELQSGVHVLRGSLFVELVALGALGNLGVGIALAVLPAYGDLLGGPAVYGFLLGAIGIGRLVGSVSAPYLERVAYGHLMSVFYLAGGGAWLAALIVGGVPTTVGLFALAWVAGGTDGVLTSTLNQRVFPVDLLGRISATKGTAQGATLPLGSLVGGVLGGLIGVVPTLMLAGSSFLVIGAYLLGRRPLRTLPAVATATPRDLRLEGVEE